MTVMTKPPHRDDEAAKLEALHITLETAATLMHEILADGPLRRVIQSLQRLTPADRAVIAEVIERETQALQLSVATEEVTGQSMHANPNARLFVRSHGGDPSRFSLEREELMVAMLRGLRVTPILTVPVPVVPRLGSLKSIRCRHSAQRQSICEVHTAEVRSKLAYLASRALPSPSCHALS